LCFASQSIFFPESGHQNVTFADSDVILDNENTSNFGLLSVGIGPTGTLIGHQAAFPGWAFIQSNTGPEMKAFFRSGNGAVIGKRPAASQLP
jgi:hypothetical protein